MNGNIHLRRQNPLGFAILTSSISLIVEGLAPEIEGLEEGDWVSLSVTVFSSQIVYLTVCMRHDQPNSLEVWVDGVKQPDS